MELEKVKQKSEKIAAKRTWGSWAQALHQTAMHPEKHKDGIIEISDDFVVLNDLYAKVGPLFFALSNFSSVTAIFYFQGFIYQPILIRHEYCYQILR